MPRQSINGLVALRTIVRERSFTRAAAQIGVSPSALSHAIRALEERVGVRLLTRTTRSVAPTAAGERLVGAIGPHLDGIDAELAVLAGLRDKPAGMVRITTGIHAAQTILWPALVNLLPAYPEVEVEIAVDTGFVDIVAERFDAGIRLGETIGQDMIAVRIGPDMRMAAVTSPAYLAGRQAPATPRDLADHRCINLRFPTHGGLYAWEFERGGRELSVRVGGQVVVNDIALAHRAALDGAGIAYLPEDYIVNDLAERQLIRVLADWCPPFPGYHLYYPSRRQLSPALTVLIEALKGSRLIAPIYQQPTNMNERAKLGRPR